MMWPNALVKELAARRCIVFLGSGASAGSLSTVGSPTHPPTWNNFLEGLISIMNSKQDEAIIRTLLDKDKYLDAAEIIHANVSKANYTDYLRQTLQLPRFQPSSIHESIFKVDPKIVVTTNYDDIYDNYCRSGNSVNGYNIHKPNDTHLVSDLRSPYRVIIKAHGCITTPADTILTRSQFFKAKQEYSNFYKILDSLFITNTVLFIGYSLSDPDIQLILENSHISAINSHPHYACISNDINPAIRDAIRNTYNIEFIEFPAGDYDELNRGLYDLALEVEDYRANNLL